MPTDQQIAWNKAGWRASRSKLSAEQVARISELRESGVLIHDLVREFGVCKNTILKALRTAAVQSQSVPTGSFEWLKGGAV